MVAKFVGIQIQHHDLKYEDRSFKYCKLHFKSVNFHTLNLQSKRSSNTMLLYVIDVHRIWAKTIFLDRISSSRHFLISKLSRLDSSNPYPIGFERVFVHND